MTANPRAEMQAKIAENDQTIERLANAVCAEKAATGSVVHDLAARLRQLSWIHNAVKDAPLALPFIPHNQRDND